MNYKYSEFEFWMKEIMSMKYDIDKNEAYNWILEETNNKYLATDVISGIYE